MAAEFFVLSQLFRMGLEAYLSQGNKKSIDIRVVHNAKKSISIDVKSVRGYSSLVVNNVDAREDHFIVFVIYNDKFEDVSETPEIFIVPSQEVGAITKKHKLERRVLKGDLAKYKNEWRLLTDAEPVNQPKVQWHESSAYPNDWGNFGHGIHFHDNQQGHGKDLVAFIEGFEWLRSRSAVVQGYHVKPNTITTTRVLSAMKRRIEQIVASQVFKGDENISGRISTIVNA